MFTIQRFDHLVLTVASLPASLDFYKEVLGMEARERQGRWSLHFGRQKINLHSVESPFPPHAFAPTPGSADICLVTDSSPEETIMHLQSHGIFVEAGPVPREGATGSMMSIYFRDPDRNLIEVAQYLDS